MDASSTLRRRLAIGAFAFAVLALGTGTGALAGSHGATEPSITDIQKYCDLEQQGAHQLAEDLRRREAELDSREHEIDSQKAEMSAAETRLTERLAALEKTRGEIQALLTQADAERDARVNGIVKMVEANHAGSVAPMFEKLDDDLAVTVLDRMNRTKAGKLLAALAPERAASLAEKMAEPIAVDLP